MSRDSENLFETFWDGSLLGRRSSDRRCVLERELSNQERTILKNEIVQNYRFKANIWLKTFKNKLQNSLSKVLGYIDVGDKMCWWQF